MFLCLPEKGGLVSLSWLYTSFFFFSNALWFRGSRTLGLKKGLERLGVEREGFSGCLVECLFVCSAFRHSGGLC